MASGKLLILSGPSGVGKDTVIDAWRALNPRVQRVVAYTTRPARPHEEHGKDYVFVTPDEFLRHAEAGDFLEFKEVHGYHYATPLRDMEAQLAAGKIVVLKIDVQGALTVMKLRPDAETVFLMPPDGEELERRIRRRRTEDANAILQRMEAAVGEMAHADQYRHRIVNEQVDRTVDELERIVGQA